MSLSRVDCEMLDIGFTPDYLAMLLQILIAVAIIGVIAVIVDVILRKRRKRKKVMAIKNGST